MTGRRPVLLVAAFALAAVSCTQDLHEAPLVEAQVGRFEKTIAVTGRLAARETLNLPAPTQGKLSFIVNEGSVVSAGDVVFSLETKQMEDTLAASRSDLTVSESALSKAEEEIRTELVKNQLSLRETNAQLQHARLELGRAETDLVKKRRQVENRILPAAEIPQAELQVEQARLSLENAEIALERLQEEIKSRKETLELDRQAAAARLGKAKAQVAEAEEFLAKATVIAPRDGVAVHARSWRGQEWKAGDEVWQRQALIELPDLAVMEVQLEIHEADISEVKPGVAARIRLEAWPELALTGTVEEVSGVAKELRDREGNNTGVRAFDGTIALDSQDPRLRPGMTARVELVLDRRAGVLVVPVAAVLREGDKAFVMLASGEKRAVTVDASSADLAVISSGIEAGDRVQVVARRPTEAPAPDEDEPPEQPAPPEGALLIPGAAGG